jgi:phosphorylase kinase alpha/beta subunit
MNHDALHALLETHFRSVEKIILSRQDPITGLLPASTAVNAHGDYTDAWVRDNVYSILCVWGLSLAYKKHAPDDCRGYLLGQSTVKLMRGLLQAMMRQSDRVEAFKQSLDPTDALHAKYGTQSGLSVVGDEEWGHLQLDATSLFLLMCAQMIASGLEIVYSVDEVNFIQNLVHYISRTYCTPDYGIWERGNKINRGATEVNCSSVGMAKAALEALDGFNLFGSIASQEAVVHVVPSDAARSRFTLAGLLPRESCSKETDAALLSIIGYPAYAVEDEALVARTRGKIVKKLAGRYGCKRFLLDGHQSSIENTSRLHYEPLELRAFEHIESEWPLFFTYLLLDALMRGDAEAAEQWRQKLEPLFVEYGGQKLLPELYIVPEEKIAAEKERPGSQERIPNENVPLVWAQSLFFLSEMVWEGLLHPGDIDPLGRRRRIGHRREIRPLAGVLAESGAVKARLLDLGFRSETPEELRPVRVMHASELSRVHTQLGVNARLHLSGRLPQETRTITTARLHLLAGKETLFLPYYFDPRGFYFGYDNKLLAEHFRSSLRFLSRHWDQPGQPVLLFMVREDMLVSGREAVVLELLRELRSGSCCGVDVATGPLAQLLRSAAAERIDNLHGLALRAFRPQAERRDSCAVMFRNGVRPPLSVGELQRLEHAGDAALAETLLNENDPRRQLPALELLWARKGPSFEVSGVPLSAIVQRHYEAAGACRDWAAVRRIADITGAYDDRLEDALLDIVTRQKRLAVGRAYSEAGTFFKPTESRTIVRTIAEFCGHNTAEQVLTQEIILHIGHLNRTEPELFDNMLTLRPWYFVQLLVGQIGRDRGLPDGEAYEFLITLAPHDIYDALRSVLRSFGRESVRAIGREHLRASGVAGRETIKPKAPQTGEFPEVEEWAQWRNEAGLIGRMPPAFYKDVWYLLQQCSALVIGDKYSVQNRIGSELTHDATAGEQSFELRLDALLQKIEAPDYRQLNVEAIGSLTRLMRQNPKMHLESDLVLDVLIGHAVRIAWEKGHDARRYDEERGRAWEAFYTLSPKEAGEAFIEAFVYLLTPEEPESESA